MAACPSCRTENPPGARFCQECGAPLTLRCGSCGEPLPASAKFCPACGAPATGVSEAERREERRVVTILFVDLVGFTERSDHADPEDVRGTLMPFHARAKADIERFGGTLDKFIGDAVMGVFGAPVAHDDDPARAVRAALRILDSMEELRRADPSLAVRVAVNTGPAMVSFGAGPQIGEAVAGDVVNTTSRMQGLAPHGSVVIGETTWRAVQDLFEAEALPPAVVKGKAEPLRVWRVVGERADRPVADTGPFVGRRHELQMLGQLFDRVVESSSGQLVTVVGEPGIGKTRLIEEFRAVSETRARWLSGRSVPYGESVTFAPVADVVRDVAGIGAADEPGRVQEALRALVEDVRMDEEDGRWLLPVLQTALGAGGDGDRRGRAGGGEDTIPSAQVAEAWSRVVAFAAGTRPLVVRLEDVHWADPVLLGLIERLAAATADRAVLILCTARPELLERNSAWGAGRVNTTSIGLAPLSREETGQLLSDLLSRPTLSADARASLLERAGGNPLYALEFVRMAGERREDGVMSSMPESVQAVIGARLDGIPDEARMLAQDAAVVGAVFWPGALAALGNRSQTSAHEGLDELARRGLVRRSPDSSLEGQAEYGFAHALIREVAYGRMTRAHRAARHLAAGRWLERVAGGQGEERAEWLARHFAEAAELAQAAGLPEVAREAAEPAVRWLLTAGDRAGRLDAARAFGLFDRAVRLAEPETRPRVTALTRSALMGRRSGSLDGNAVLERYEESVDVTRRIGDAVEVADALIRLSSQAGALGDTERSREVLAEAVRMLEAQSPGPVLARAYAYRAEQEMFAGRVKASMQSADQALAMTRGSGHEDIVVMSLHIRGDARCSMGDRHGLDDLREALRLAREAGNAADIVTSSDYLAEWLWAIEGPAVALPQYEEGLAVAERRGVVSQGQWTKAGSLGPLFELGRWDEVDQRCEEMLAVGAGRLDGALFAVVRTMQTRLAILRGRPAEAASSEELMALARPIGELHVLAPALVVSALVSGAMGSREAAAGYLEEFTEVTADAATEYRQSQLADVTRLAVALDRLHLAAGMVDRGEGVGLRGTLNLLSARAALAEARGDVAAAAARYGEAIEEWRVYGNPLEEAHALLGRGRCAGDDAAGAADVARAHALLRSLGAATI